MTAIDDFFKHLNMPIVLANDVLQGKPIAAIEDLARITHNAVFGLGGFYDIATRLGIPENDEDFGQTLGYYGVPPGPYLMVPILGPYTLRDGIGEIIDTTATGYLYSPIWTSAETLNLNTAELWAVSIGQKGVQLLNLRAIYDEELEESRRDAFDYYVFVRNAYLQSRRAKVADQSDAPVIDENELYFFDDEEDEEEDYDDF
jgi:phospholipid-binding lipoprotein MlaA